MIRPSVSTPFDAIQPTDVLTRLAALKATSTPELKQQWRTLFGTEPPPYNRRFLESRLAYRIQELAYGGLKPETVGRLEALGSRSTARTSPCVASGGTFQLPARACYENTRAWSTS